jgi:hypothetical protein
VIVRPCASPRNVPALGHMEAIESGRFFNSVYS